MIAYILIISFILLHKNNLLIIKKLYSSDYVAKVKIKGKGIQNILCPEIKNIDEQTYPNEIFIKNETYIINNTGGSYFINSEEDENFIIMKWYNYSNSTRGMFENCINIIEIDLTEFDLSLIINMDNTFWNCKSLISIKFGNYSTPLLNSTFGVFNNCFRLSSIDLSMFNTENVIDMGLMFYNCSNLKSLIISNFKTDKVEKFL